MPARHTALDRAAAFSNTELLGRLHRLVRADRRLTVRLLAHIAEVDARKLYLERGCSSMHVYCVARLRMSDAQAYRRIHAARVARRFPRVLDMLARNELHLSAIALLKPHLTRANCDELLDVAVHKTSRQLEVLLAERAPQPDAPTFVRRLPERPASNVSLAPNGDTTSDGPESHEPGTREQLASAESPHADPSPRAGSRGSPRADVKPTAFERYRIQLTASGALHAKLREAQALLRHQLPDGDIAEIFERALDCLIADTKKKRFGVTGRPRPNSTQAAKAARPDSSAGRSRHIPNAVKRAVFERDQGRCTFVDAEGNRCGESGFIQFHHRRPFATGGEHTVENLTLRCACHNRYEAELELGRETIEAKVREARQRALFAREAHTQYLDASPPDTGPCAEPGGTLPGTWDKRSRARAAPPGHSASSWTEQIILRSATSGTDQLFPGYPAEQLVLSRAAQPRRSDSS